ncbi:MAG: MATE family efflux transporter [Planctomycetes bacterium]|nr:MATE family efflux transporter [Planctomycetota bacterium]
MSDQDPSGPGPAGRRPQALAARGLALELPALWRLSWPVACSHVGIVLLGTVEALAVGHLGGDALAALTLGETYAFLWLVVAFGVLMAVEPVVAQAWGAGQWHACGRALQRGLVLAVVFTPPLSAAWWTTGPALRLLGEPPALAEAAAGYVRGLMPGLLPVLVFQALRQFLQGTGAMRPVMWVVCAANLVNALLQWALVFGHLGAPALGLGGAALATSLDRGFLCVALALVAVRQRAWRSAWPGWTRDVLARGPMARLLALGTPIGLQYGVEVWGISAMTFLMGWIGPAAVAGHGVALKYASLSFMVPLGVSVAAAVRVGQSVGRRDAPGMRRAGWTAMAAGAAFMAAVAVVFLAWPRPLCQLFSGEPGVVLVAAALLPIAGLFQVFDGLQAVGFGVLRGTGDTRVPFAINVLGYYAVGLPVGCWLGFGLGMGPTGLWYGLLLALALVAGLILARVAFRLRGPVAPLSTD